MTSKNPYSRALTLAELNIGITSSTCKLQGESKSKSTTKAKRLVDLFSGTNSSILPFQSTQNQSDGKYTTFKVPKSNSKPFSTSKKPSKPTRLENTAVRRTINFMPITHMNDNRLKSTESYKNPSLINEDNISTRSDKTVKPNINAAQTFSQLKMDIQPVVETPKAQPRISAKAFEYHTSTEVKSNDPKDDMATTLFTQYRDVNESFDVSYCEKSPTNNSGDNESIKNTPSKPSDLSDSICDLLNKADLTSNRFDISKHLLEIKDQIQKNINVGKKQKSLIVAELIRNEKCLGIINDLLKSVSDNHTQLANVKQTKIPPAKRRSSIVVPVRKMSLRPRLSAANESITPSKKSADKIDTVNNGLRDFNSLKVKTPHDLRKVAILNTLDKSSRNIENITPSKKDKKSFQMFTSLKNSSNFLKTPNDKKKAANRFLTPISKSRQTTALNIKEQLERLYDE